MKCKQCGYEEKGNLENSTYVFEYFICILMLGAFIGVIIGIFM